MLPPPTQPPTDSRLRAVLVGAGEMGRTWARALADCPDVELVGWVDVAPARARAGIAELGLGELAVERDARRALDTLAPDFLLDAAVPEAHHEITLCSLERGVAVLGEKPMDVTVAAARELVAAADRTGVAFAVNQQRRFAPGLVAFRDLIRERLGTIGQLNADFFRAPRFGGFREQMDSPLIVDMAIHTFDAARFLTGADPVSVSCSEFNPAWSWYRGAACAVAEFELTDGIRFSYRGSWCAGGFETSWESSWRAIGSRGSALWDGESDPLAEPADAADRDAGGVRGEAPPAAPAGGEISGVLADFVGALRSGTRAATDCRDNIRSLAMVMAALESSRTGRRVEVDW